MLQEYEAQETKEAQFVKGMSALSNALTSQLWLAVVDLDRFEMASQGLLSRNALTAYTDDVSALEYERRYEDKKLDPFYESSLPKINHPEVRAWGGDLMTERQEMLQDRERTRSQSPTEGNSS